MKMRFDPEKPTYLMSPPPHCWRAAGNAYSDAANAFRGGTNPREAGDEWLKVANQLATKANIIVMPVGRRPQLTFDKCFTADAGAYFKKLKGFVLANHAAEHRMQESDYVGGFLEKKLRLKVIGRTKNKWEGSSCFRVSPQRTFAVLGYGGGRASRESCEEIAEYLDVPKRRILRIKMEDEPGRILHIHLDTMLATLSSKQPLVLVCRAAFADAGRGWDPDRAYGRLTDLVESEVTMRGDEEVRTQLHCVSSKDGIGYATNLREDPDGHVYVPNGLTEFYTKVLKKYGYKVHPFNVKRLFWDGGGAAACLTNDLTAAVEDGWVPPAQYLYPNVRQQLEGEINNYPDKQLCWN